MTKAENHQFRHESSNKSSYHNSDKRKFEEKDEDEPKQKKMFTMNVGKKPVVLNMGKKNPLETKPVAAPIKMSLSTQVNN